MAAGWVIRSLSDVGGPREIRHTIFLGDTLMSLLSWIEDLLKDKDAGAAFLSSPVAVMEAAGYDAHCGIDARDASLALVDSKHIDVDGDGSAIIVGGGHGSGADYIKQIVQNYSYKDNSETEIDLDYDIDDRDTTVDASVDNSQNIGDVTMTGGTGVGSGPVFAPLNTNATETNANVASGDNSNVADRGGEIDQSSETNLAGGDVVTRGGENNDAGDDLAQRGGENNDTEVEIEISDNVVAGDDAQVEEGDGSVNDDGFQAVDNDNNFQDNSSGLDFGFPA